MVTVLDNTSGLKPRHPEKANRPDTEILKKHTKEVEAKKSFSISNCMMHREKLRILFQLHINLKVALSQ